ncbi:thiamine-phosphate kinase, partial [Acinetobacter johnsonii]
GARLILEKLPVDPVLQQLEERQRWQYALAGGDDYELCFTITPQNYEKLLQKQLDVKITMIGQIVEQTKLTFEHLGSEY